MRRPTRHDYDGPGSFERLHEAALRVADADTEDDVAHHRACVRLRAAAVAYVTARRREALRKAAAVTPEAVPAE